MTQFGSDLSVSTQGSGTAADEAAELLSIRLGLPTALIEEMAQSSLGGGLLGMSIDSPGVDVAIALGLVVSNDDALVVDPWCVEFFRGGRGMSPAQFGLTVPTPTVSGPSTEHLHALLSDYSMLVEVVSPSTSMAPAHAAAAMTMLELQPTMFNLVGRGFSEIEGLMPRLYTHAKLLGQGIILLIDSDLAASPDFVTLLQEGLWPTVYVVERRARDHTPRAPFATIEVGHSDASTRRQAWSSLLLVDDDDSLDQLATLPLSIADMYEAFTRCASEAAMHGAEPQMDDLARHGRTVLMEGLSRLAELREPRSTMSDLVFDPALTAGLTELTAAAKSMIARNGGRPLGLRALFTGPSGTGKTAAAESLGDALGIPVMFVDVSRIVNKYIGETEKNLDFVLDEAQRSGAILVFDEGESLFGARTGGAGGGAGAQASNRQTAYLLARLEQHTGIVVVASNFPGSIDAAFSRRFHFAFTFAVPVQAEREKLWVVLAKRFGITEAFDVAAASRYELAGGNIANVCYLTSLLEGSHEGSTDDLVAHLLRREYIRLSKRL